MTSKSTKKKNVAQEAQPNAALVFSPYFDVFCDLSLHVQTHGNKESTYFIWGETKKSVTVTSCVLIRLFSYFQSPQFFLGPLVMITVGYWMVGEPRECFSDLFIYFFYS